jgi:hypothetical protein
MPADHFIIGAANLPRRPMVDLDPDQRRVRVFRQGHGYPFQAVGTSRTAQTSGNRSQFDPIPVRPGDRDIGRRQVKSVKLDDPIFFSVPVDVRERRFAPPNMYMRWRSRS